MAENISVDIGVNAQELERALKRIDQMFNKGWGKGSEGSGDKQISDLRRIITSLVNQQNIYLRAAERSGRVHAARMAEQERYGVNVVASQIEDQLTQEAFRDQERVNAELRSKIMSITSEIASLKTMMQEMAEASGLLID